MTLSARQQYALKAILELSLHWPNRDPLVVSVISKKQAIPLKFLTQILLSLKSIGLVESIRGKQGGYLLRKKPSEISLADVLDMPTHARHSSNDLIQDIIDDLEAVTHDHLTKIKISRLVDRVKAGNKTPMYTI